MDRLDLLRNRIGGVHGLEFTPISRLAGHPVALYAHYNPLGRVSPMVLAQLEMLRQNGFATVLISMSPIDEASDLEALRPLVVQVLLRPSFGRDFGAWKAAWTANRKWLLEASEILLINDTLLGPLFPMEPVFSVLRGAGEGVSGLTDSPDGVPHLQSYFLLFRGKRSIAALDGFWRLLRLSAHKRTMIERGELGLSRYLGSASIPLFALFSYTALEDALLADPEAMEALLLTYPLIPLAELPAPGSAFGQWSRVAARLDQILSSTVLNPTHYFYRILVQQLGFPFIKTELLLQNPARLGGLRGWKNLVPPDAPVSVDTLQTHLTMMAQQPNRKGYP